MSPGAATLTLVAQMYQDQEVLNGWDAVLNLLESSINGFFQQQWGEHTGNSGQMSISTIWCENVQTFQGQVFTNVTQFDVVLGPPLFQFQDGQAAVTVTQKILSGSLKQGTKGVPSTFNPSACGCPPNDPSVQWGAPQSIDTSLNPTLSGTVALEQVQGLVNADAHSVVLDFAKGAFTLSPPNALVVQGVKDDDLCDQLKGWFATNRIKYILASLDFRNLSNQPALTPTSFRFNVKRTNAGNTIVQLLITTNGSQPTGLPIVEEPIPTADGATCCLMISSRILYQDLFVGSFNAGQSGLTVQAVAPASNIQSWGAEVSGGSVSTGEMTPPNQPYPTESGLESVTLDANEWSLVGARFSPSTSMMPGGFIQLAYNQSPSLTANVAVSDLQTTFGPFAVPLNVQLTIGAIYLLSVVESASQQALQIMEIGSPAVTVAVVDPSGKLTPAAIGSSTQSINDSLSGAVSAQIQSSIGAVSFAPVSIFALENLIFPGNQLIQMANPAFPPGDLLIVGTLG